MGSVAPAQLMFFAEAPAEDPGQKHLASIPLEQRRTAGQVYTPSHVVRFVLDRAEHRVEEAGALRVLDPACGAGAFMCEVAARILRAVSPAGGRWTPARRARLHAAIEARVFGVDVDPLACQLARESVIRTVEALTGALPPAGFFQRNVAARDFLLGDLPDDFPRRFGLIVGNPPYVAATRISAADKARLRSRFKTAFGRLDLYTLFMERAVSLLDAAGTLAFITPDKFLVTQTSQPLRDLLLATGELLSVARFRSHRVFDAAATVPCVTVFRRTSTPAADHKTEVLECAVDADRVTISSMSRIQLRTLGASAWHLSQQHDTRLAERIEAAHPRLERYVVRVSAGLATGLDGLLVMPQEVAARVEPDLLRTAIRGRDLQPFQITPPGLQIFLPYQFNADGSPRLVSLQDYPRARELLEPHRAVLEKRHCVRVWGKAWYDLHDPVPFDLAATSKIMVPDVATNNRFAFDPGEFCPLHSAYYIVPRGIDPEYLTAILNSGPVEFLIRLRAPMVKDGFSRYRRQFLLPLPIPEANARARRRLVTLSRSGDVERVTAHVADLFGLGARDMELIGKAIAARSSSRTCGQA